MLVPVRCPFDKPMVQTRHCSPPQTAAETRPGEKRLETWESEKFEDQAASPNSRCEQEVEPLIEWVYIWSSLQHPVSEAKAATQSVIPSTRGRKWKKKNTTICTLCTTPFVIPRFFRRDLISKKRQETPCEEERSRPALLIRLIRRRAALIKKPSYPGKLCI
jgi:hypothetical protein